MVMKLIKIFTFLTLVTFTLSGCSDTKLVTPETEGEKLQILYSNAMELVKKRDFVDAAILFEDIERQYPYSKWSNQAQLMTAFCYYKSQFHDESLDALEDVERDQSMTVKSKKAFYEVINKYPDSEFVEDAYLKIDIINDRLAAKEIEIARYYQFKQQWISAINRYNKILDDYDTSVYTEEALHRLVEIYYSLGLTEEAKRYASTLGFNFPDSDWYIKSYELVKDLS